MIPFGVVMGEAFGFLVSPYFYELKQIDGMVNRIDGLKEELAILSADCSVA